MLLQIDKKLGLETLNLIREWKGKHNNTPEFTEFTELQTALIELHFEIEWRIYHLYYIAIAENTMDEYLIKFEYERYRQYITNGDFPQSTIKELIENYNKLYKINQFRK